MRSAAGPLPFSLAAPRLSPRLWLAIAAGLGTGVCAYAGLYPRFDEGSLRIVVALTSAPFAAAVVATSLGARTPGRAFGLAMLLAALLGIASTIIPAALLTRTQSNEFFVACMFGAFFGAPTGALYGLPLAVLSASGHRHVRAQTHESTDHAARVSGLWLFFISLLGLMGTVLLDEGKMDWVNSTMVPQSPLPALLAVAAGIGGLALALRSLTRQRSRSGWIDRVRSGLEPAFRLRPVELRDRIETLPRLSDGGGLHDVTVVEWLPDEIADATSGTAYRVNATGCAVAIVSAEPPITI